MTERTLAAHNVADLQEIFPQCFAIYGTALGSLREQDVIEHDPDTDCGILSEHFTWDQVSQAVRKGFEIVAVFGMRHYGMEIAFRRNGIKCDLMLFYQDKDRQGKLFNCLWKNGGRNGMADEIVHEYDAEMLTVIQGKLGEETIRTLGESYVRHVYGENWKIPVRKWDWQTDHLCKKTG